MGGGTYRKGYDFLTQEVPCVYIIRCVANGALYICQTGSDLRRNAEHFTELRLGIHKNKGFQRDYSFFGAEQFYFRIVHVIKNKDYRIWVEGDYIIRAKERELYRNGVKIYNIAIPRREIIGHEFKQDENE